MAPAKWYQSRVIELMSDRIVYFNGEYLPEAAVGVPLYDSALQIGDMCFEVTRTFRGEPFRLRQHLERLAGSLAALKIDVGQGLAELESITLEALRRNQLTEPTEVDWQIIHNVSRGPTGILAEVYPPVRRRPTVIISCFPITHKLASVAEKYTKGVDLVVPRQRAIPPELLPTHIKTRGRLHYKLADLEIEAEHPGCQAVLLDASGQITEGTNNNVFLVRDGTVLTPPAEVVLSGVTRGVVLELAAKEGIAVEEGRLEPEDALAADEIFVTSTSVGILHARTFNGQLIRQGTIGPVATRLRGALDRYVGLSFAEQAAACAARLQQTPGSNLPR